MLGMEEKECTLVKVLKLVETEELGKRCFRVTKTHGDVSRLSAFKLQKKTDCEEKDMTRGSMARVARLVESRSGTANRSHEVARTWL